MSWRWRRGVAGLMLASVGLALGSALWLWLRFDATQTKAWATQSVQAHFERQLDVRGETRLRLLPRLEIELADVRLSERGLPSQWASFQRVRIAPQWLAWLRGDRVIQRMTLIGGELNLRRDAQGKSNIDDLLHGSRGMADEWDLNSIALQDVRLRVQDAVQQIDGEVLVQTLQTGRLEAGMESSLHLQAQAQFKQPQLTGRVDLSAQLTPGQTSQSTRLRGLAVTAVGDTPWATGVKAQIQGDLNWNGEQQAMDLRNLRMSWRGTTGTLRLTESRLTATQIQYDATGQTLRLSELHAQADGLLKGQSPSVTPERPQDRPVTFEVDWPLMEVSRTQLHGSPVKGRLSVGGNAPLAATFQSAAPKGQFKAIVLPAFETVFSQDDQGHRLNGMVRARLTLEPSAAAITLDELDGQVKFQDPGLPALTVVLRGQAQANPQRAQWDLTGRWDESPFEAQGQATYATAPIDLHLQARIAELDLTRWWAPPTSKATPPSPSAIDMSPLRTLNGRFKLHAGHLTFQTLALSDLDLDAYLETGILRLNSLSARAWNGRIDAKGLADARASRVALQGVMRQVSVRPLLRDLGQKPLLDGSGHINFDLDTAGRSGAEMSARLQGVATVQLHDGAIRGIDLVQGLKQARPALLQKQSVVLKAHDEADKTDFSEFTARFHVAEGIARNADLDVKGPLLRFSGGGWIDVNKSRMDYMLRTTVTPSPKNPEHADLMPMRTMILPVHVAGNLSALDWQVSGTPLPNDPAVRKNEGSSATSLDRGDSLQDLRQSLPAQQARRQSPERGKIAGPSLPSK